MLRGGVVMSERMVTPKRAKQHSSPTAVLARFAAETCFEDLPGEVIHHVKRCLLDYLGLVIGASDEPAVSRALAAVEDLGGRPQAHVLGTAVRTSAPQAALVNGI